MGVQRHTVPNFKGLIELYLDFQAQGRDSTFTICHALVKRAILHYKKAYGRFVFSTTVGANVQLHTWTHEEVPYGSLR